MRQRCLWFNLIENVIFDLFIFISAIYDLKWNLFALARTFYFAFGSFMGLLSRLWGLGFNFILSCWEAYCIVFRLHSLVLVSFILLKWFLASHFFYHHALTLWPLFCLFDSRFRINLILWSTESNCAARNNSLCSSRVVQMQLSLGTLLCNQRHTGHIRVRWFWGAKLFFKLPVLLCLVAAAEQSVKNLR